MSPVRHLNIATKLTIWACALIILFFATSAYLFRQVRHDAEISSRLVTENHDLDSAIQRMLERLYSVQDNIRRYRLLGGDEAAVGFIVEDLSRFGEILNETLKKHPQYTAEWQELTSEYEITLGPGETLGDNLTPNVTVRDWTDILEQSLLDNVTDMQARLTRLHEAGQQAADIGLYGLIACLILGVGGSLLLAYTLNRSLAEVRTGIRELGTGATPRDVRILSNDELGELALAFNAMAARLRREERMRADFIAMLSHEIRTPLTSVREAVDLIETGAFGEVNEKQRQFLRIAEKESARLSDLLTRLLSVSRMESEELVLRPESMDGKRLIESTLERLLPAARAKSVTLESQADDALTLTADTGHIRQVLMNLVGNGIKFSPEGGHVSVTGTGRRNDILFCVRDNGPGIPPEEQDRVFHKYYREPGVRDSIDGAGLGLAISKRIILAHGGRIWVESEPGQGSNFFFSLPSTPAKDIA
ncbi:MULTISPECIES: HAMP domain-containing sensor histidine kinase [unclassified Pseudodesulfovibrio]|uniref:sensor histidine kinase n=1 Tax=unclassified Pseudodesulfovibrio TaxID=2661612 RepID=UPI000FEBBFFF|nr:MULTISPECIES: HAMP domain-containing sensor histidine kinase [unclassified Pseudodesulfovibrio]MCJ2164453.1 HAMP domain-containing histidine kinase [Pseudodesulfovibrio sp. S3-i]RWU04655.1 sensor histidine kinase [Pseudodesulfovibrio sp. S3]